MNNIEKVQQIYSDFGNQNISGIVNAVAEDVTWIDPGYPDIPFGSNGRSKKEIPDFFKSLGENIEYTRFEPREFISDNNTVIVVGYHEGSVKPTKKFIAQEWVMVWKFNDKGKVNYYRAYLDTNELAKAFRN